MREHLACRQAIVAYVRRELIGPSPDDAEEVQREFLSVSPLSHYAMGVLFPQKTKQDQKEDVRDSDATPASEEDLLPDEVFDGGTAEPRSGNTVDPIDAPHEDEPLNLANEFSPSALGITFRVVGSPSLLVSVRAGAYEKAHRDVPNPRAGQQRMDGSVEPETIRSPVFVRTPIAWQHQLETKSVGRGRQHVEGTAGRLRLHSTVRADGQDRVVTVMLVNHHQAAEGELPEARTAWFQAGLEVRSTMGEDLFMPIDRESGLVLPDEQASMELLYRHRRSFALGHGCAGDWRRDETTERTGRTGMVCSSSFPLYEVAPVLPREAPFSGKPVRLSMMELSDGAGDSEGQRRLSILDSLKTLCADYSAWIDSQEAESATLAGPVADAARRHLNLCRRCLDRMRQGVETLASDPNALLAFRLANRAMLMQQIHTALPVRRKGEPFPVELLGYKAETASQRRWRPFQLAFILMNVRGTVDQLHPDHDLVDLIWFPTGGGKTEAYLGLTAFTIALRRLRRGSDAGTTVLMRYTLRLLTAQQFQRASALILALEVLRQDRFLDADLGESPISIGLWVGRSLSPNRRKDALHALKKLREQDSGASNPFQVLQCPWCRAEFDRAEHLGYIEHRGPGAELTVAFRCPDPACRWSGPAATLPIVVIDEDIYESPPALLIGTIDKFAQISWLEATGALFGLGHEFSPPELVIQDELHLISGPLGSVVGLYETAIERLCCRNGRSPKIVASTATIRRAAEQCLALYGRGAFEFPPAGLKAGDSYFAYEDSKAPGRLYAGVFPSALKSMVTGEVRTCSALLQAVRQAAEVYGSQVADTYGTLVWYFNSLRELGHATTLCDGDIQEQLVRLCKRTNVDRSLRRRIHERVELTSRRTADEIPHVLEHLEMPWSPEQPPPFAVDVLLATNMISVGIDVPRLGLMVVTGQPKTSAEYIQATSRVGRRFPGLVVTLYNQSRSRDRSHFERFLAYHQAIYRHVEPSSVTPFSPPARERGLRGVLVALARLAAGVSDPARISEHLEEIGEEVSCIVERVRRVDPAEADDAAAELRDWIEHWKRTQPAEYGHIARAPDAPTLMYPYGARRHEEFHDEAWPVLTSMRNVDGTCEGRVVRKYGEV